MERAAFSLDVWSIFLGFGALNGFFLASILWFSRKGLNHSNRLLSLLLVCISLFTTELIIARTEIYFQNPWLIMVSFPFAYFIAPAFLWYAKSLIGDDPKFNSKELLHLFLPILAFGALVPFYFWNGPDKIGYIEQFQDPANLTFRHRWLGGVFLLQTLVYFLLILKLLKDYQRRYKLGSSGTAIQHLEWLNRLLFVFLAFIIFNAGVSFLLLLARMVPFPSLEMNMIILTLFAHTVGYNAINHPARIFPTLPKGAKYARSTMDTAQIKSRLASLKDYMISEKPYLDPDLTLGNLAENLNLSKDHLSQIINAELSMSFYDFVNSHRVHEAKERLLDPKNEAYSILGIALDSGFSSKSSFNRIFKKQLGVTPSQYLANQPGNQ